MNTRREFIRNTGAIAALSAVPALILPKTANAALPIPAGYVRKYNAVHSGRYLDMKVTTDAYDYFHTDGDTYYRVGYLYEGASYARIEFDKYYVGSGWTTLTTLDGNSRRLPRVNGPWVTAAALAGFSLLAQSHINCRSTAGWVKYKIPVAGTNRYTIWCRYWVWDNSQNKWRWLALVLTDAVGVDNVANYDFHNGFTNSCNLFSNRLNSMLVAAVGVGSIAIYAFVDTAPLAELTAKSLTAISLVGYAHYDWVNQCAGYGETLLGLMASKGAALVAEG